MLFFPALLAAQEPAAAPPRHILFANAGQRLEQPQLAVRADGTLALVFVQDGVGVRVALRPPGKDWQQPSTVCELRELAVGAHRGPRIAWAGHDLVVACIESHWDAATRKATGSGNLTVRRSRDDGRTWSAPVQVNSADGSAREGLHALAADGDRVVLAWLDPRGEPRGQKLFCAASSDGGATFGVDAAAWTSPSGSICPCCHPSLALDGAGRAVLMWRDAIAGDRDLFTAVLEPAAAHVAAPRPAGEGHWHLDACPMDGGGLALDGAGQPVTVWRREHSVYWSRAGGRERLLGSGRNPAVAVGGGDALAVWEGEQGLAAARIALATPDAPATPRELGDGAAPAVASRGGGAFTVVAELRRGATVQLLSIDP